MKQPWTQKETQDYIDRAEAEIGILLAQLTNARATLKLVCERLREPVQSIDYMGHQEMATDPLRLELAEAIERLCTL